MNLTVVLNWTPVKLDIELNTKLLAVAGVVMVIVWLIYVSLTFIAIMFGWVLLGLVTFNNLTIRLWPAFRFVVKTDKLITTICL